MEGERDEDAGLADLIELCRATPDDALAYASVEHRGSPTAGSPVAVWTEAGGPACAGGAEFSLLITAMSGEQLRGLGAVLGQDAHTWAPRPLVRSIFEWCADAFWLSDDRLDARETAARALVYDAVAIGEPARLAGRARTGNGFMQNWPERQEQLDAKVESAGFPPVTRAGRTRHWSLEGQTIGDRTSRVEAFLSRFFPGSTKELAWYAWMSEMTHPSATSIRTLTVRDTRAEAGRLMLPLQTAKLIRGWTRSAAAAWAATAQHTAGLFGWSTPVLDTWAADLRALLQRPRES